MILKPDEYAEQFDGGCATAFQPMELPPNLGPMWVFGQTILRKYYTVYDWNSQRVGVALARHTSAIRVPPTEPPTVPPTERPEKCEDDSRSMEKGMYALPDCPSFRLSCRLRTPPGRGAAAAERRGEGSGVVVSK